MNSHASPRAAALAALVLAALACGPGRDDSPRPTSSAASAPLAAPSPAPAATPAAPPSPAASPAAPAATATTPPSPAATAAPPLPWLLPVTRAPAARVFFSEDGALLITTETAGDLRIWDLATRDEPLLLAGHVVPVDVVAVSDDHRLLASAAADGTLRLWFLEDNLALDPAAAGPSRRPAMPGAFNPPIDLEGARGAVQDLAFDPRSRHLAAGTDRGEALVWSVDDPRSPPRALAHKGAAVARVVFDPSGARLLTLARGKAPRLWAHAQNAPPVLLGPDRRRGEYRHAAFAADASAIALLAADGDVELWRGDGGERLSVVEPAPGPAPALEVSPQSAIYSALGRLPADAPTARIWPAEPDPRRFPWPASARVLTVDPAGPRVLDRGGASRPVRVEAPVIDAALAPDGRHVAAVEEGGRVRVWPIGGR